MGTNAIAAAAQALGQAGTTTQAEEAWQPDSAFLKLLEDFDATQETDSERRARRAREADEAQRLRERTKKMLELQARIAQLRSRIAGGSGTTGDEAELGMLQTELFWLTAG